MNKIRIGLVQMQVVEEKEKNVQRAENLIKKASSQGAELVVLPEMFNCPYQVTNFPLYAEKEGDFTWKCLSAIAREEQIFLVGGSVPEVDKQGRVYNTSYIFNRNGSQVGKHRKMHLFDIDVEGGQTFKESDSLTPGDSITVFPTPFGKIGVIICYDIRFPELARLTVKKGARMIIVPGAFNMTTGPAHWELLFRMRSLDNQVYTAGVAPARDNNSGYISYANSLIADPWGRVVKRLGADEDILITDLDLDIIDKVREELPLLQHLRQDIYELKEISK